MKWIVFVGAIAAIAATATTADAKIKRSCDARMFIVLQGHDGYPPGERTLERFSATASCPHGQPNKCRRRAVDKAFACMQASWDERWDRTTPDECKQNKGVKRYSMDNIKCDLFDRICSEMAEMGHPALRPGTAILKGQTSGNTNSCSVTNHTFGEYTVNICETIAARAEHCGSN